jgi:hypothetical protein
MSFDSLNDKGCKIMKNKRGDEKSSLCSPQGRLRVTGLLRITVLLLLLTVIIGCYPPSYYDYWNRPSMERYMDWVEKYDYSYPYTYYNPYYYPYFYFPFSFSFYYSYDRYHFDRPHYGRNYRRSPYDRHHYDGWWRKK